jgi:hypothetical protein
MPIYYRFLCGVYAGIVAPLKDELRDLKYDKLSMVEHGEFRLREDKQLEALQNEINALKSEVAYLRDNQVTRAEHTTHWDKTKENIASAVKSIDELRRDFGGQYTVTEKLKELQQELNELRLRSPPSFQLPAK